MKKNLLVALAFAMMPMMSWGQTVSQDDVVTLDSRSRAFRQGEVLVKFKTSARAQLRVKADGSFASSGMTGVDAVLDKIGVTDMEELMPLTGMKRLPARAKAPNGSEIKVAELSQLYRVKFDATKNQNVYAVVDQLKTLADVEYAEPNYLVYSLAEGEGVEGFTDPFVNLQWGPAAINATKLWNKPTISDKRPVIAILDTGVDITHPDLAGNIWTNSAEQDGAEGEDDDNNGFADDLHGWDFVNQTGRMDDFNGHGTHCAGIAAAVGGNGKGIVGANPYALIMPVTVMQSDGVGDVATIIKGIDYAAANGADVISMSFGGYAYSLAEEQALGRAYATAVLVAAAGNDYKCIYPGRCEINKSIDNGPMYPAAFQFVFGVEASVVGGLPAPFSNFDHDGPLFSQFSESQLYNYELRAPGQGIYSTYPDGKYKSMSGTSMACPMAAGAISRLLQVKEYPNQEVLFGDLIHTRNGDIDVLAAYNLTDADRKPELNIVTYELNDTEGGDGDLRADAGETIALYPTIKNSWGQANNIKVWLTLGENEDETIVEFLDSEHVDFGLNLSSYAKAKSTNPIRFKVNDNCVDGRHIKLVLHATCDNIEGELIQDFTITAENGVEIGGVIAKDDTLHAGVHYIVTTSIGIPEGVTLTIEPGSILKFKGNAGISNAGTVIANGTPENRITFTKADLDDVEYSAFSMKLTDVLNYIIVENFHIKNNDSFTGKLSNAIIRNCTFESWQVFSYLRWDNSMLYNNVFESDNGFAETINMVNTNYIGNTYKEMRLYTTFGLHRALTLTLPKGKNNIVGNICDDKIISLYSNSSSVLLLNVDGYLGTSSKEIANKSIWDINDGIGFSEFDLTNILTRPNPEAPGIVWKVVVNGYDAQDEFEQLPPLGVGKHKFEVYYSKPVSKDLTPTIAMGVRPPYNSTSIAENGSWNEAGDVYTAYVTITGKMANDGLNRIRVEGGEDLEHFEIPIENTRFNVLIQAAGSMSSGFMGEAGLGKVSLTWDDQDENVDDILGFNMYRYQMQGDTLATDTVRLNERMIDSDVTTYTDFDVKPGETYYYYYKIMRTSLMENSPSKTVAVTPRTASKGDANGSESVDVADVVTEINYMTGQEPQPFIFEAADVNADLAINILDVVGTINIILPAAEAGINSINERSASYSVEDGILYLDTPVDIAGLQFAFNAPKGSEFTPLAAIDSFEKAGQWTADSRYMYIVYSMSGKTLKAGRHAILKIGEAETTEVVLSDTQGHNVIAMAGNATGISAVEKVQMTVAYPNPFADKVTIPYAVGKDGRHNIRIAITDLAGKDIHVYNAVKGYGNHSYIWQPATALAKGLYFATLYVDGRQIQTAKLIHE